MKKLSLLFSSMLLSGVASAAPYIVYSGATHSNVATTTGTMPRTCDIYLIADLSDTSSYALLEFDATTRQGEIEVFPITSPTVTEANLNFFGSVDPTNGAASTAVLSIGDMMIDSSSNTYVSHAYATGQLTTRNNVLAPGRTEALSVATATGTVSFPAAAAVLSQGLPYAPVLSGTSLGYTISSTGTLTAATGAGTFSLLLDPALTAAANIGGELDPASTAAVGNTDAAISPVINSSPAPTAAQAYTTWLTNLATALNVSLISSSTSTTTTSDAGDEGDDGGSVSFSGASSGSGLVLTGAGTTILSGNLYAGSTIISNGTLSITGATLGSAGLTSGATFSVGGSGTGVVLTSPTTGGGVLTLNGNTSNGTITNDNLTFNLNAGTGTTGTLTSNVGTINLSGDGSAILTATPAGSSSGVLTLNTGTLSTGSITLSSNAYTLIGGTGLMTGTGFYNTGYGSTLTIAQGTVTITAVNGSNASGSVSITGGSYDYNFVNTPFVLNGSSDLSSLTVGTILSGSVIISSTGTVSVTTQ
ncbi:MAG TPA: hypothetical protein VHY09_04310 [Candidatus Methylacidiphilales bacterium]|jgi:hypothetical protein|nr:hypothetical protein [Candidatus Methylacidiphilales bacterium]